uniref:hypothetical protein n=1 Tax=Acetatifactor sp. TaxID=1872090 RepID=UPI0040566C5F
PDPFVQSLKDHILHCSVPFNLRHCQINFGIISPDTGEGTMLNIRYRKIKPKLQLIINWNGIICPTVSFVIGTALYR